MGLTTPTRSGWGRPPTKEKRNSRVACLGPVQQWLRELQKHPGRWAWREYAIGSGATARGANFRKLGFETFATRTPIKRKGFQRLYVRWPKEAR